MDVFSAKKYTLYTGDVMDVLPTLPAESYTCCVTDPPYGLGETPDMTEVLTHWLAGDDYKAKGNGFMGKSWDSFVPGPAVWKEIFRVLKPGAVLLAFGGTRTADLLSIAIRLAGFEKFDEIEYFHAPNVHWIYGSAIPKGRNISKAIDAEAGAEREVVGVAGRSGSARNCMAGDFAGGEYMETVSATDEAKVWDGYNVALKPAHEPILCFRKPRIGTYAQNVLTYGAGALNIDDCRIDSGGTHGSAKSAGTGGGRETANENGNAFGKGLGGIVAPPHPAGRYPSNIIFDERVAELLDDQCGESKSVQAHRGAGINGRTFQAPEYESTVRGHNDSGGVSRFFKVLPTLIYQAKASQSGRGEDNTHNTVKPLALSEHLAKLVLPPEEYRKEARLLVPFFGSGTEILGGIRAGWLHVDGIERDEEYVEIAKRRLDAEMGAPRKIVRKQSDYDAFAEMVAAFAGQEDE